MRGHQVRTDTFSVPGLLGSEVARVHPSNNATRISRRRGSSWVISFPPSLPSEKKWSRRKENLGISAIIKGCSQRAAAGDRGVRRNQEKKKKKSVYRYQILCDPRFKAYLPRERLPIDRSSARQQRKHAEVWDERGHARPPVTTHLICCVRLTSMLQPFARKRGTPSPRPSPIAVVMRFCRLGWQHTVPP